jgi:hypothetical protein
MTPTEDAMQDIFAVVNDPGAGVDVMSIEEFVRERYFGPTAASIRAELGRYMDAHGVPASDPTRGDVLQYAEQRIDAMSKDALGTIRGAIAEGTSLEKIGTILGVALMRGPEFKVPHWNTEAWMKCVTVLAFRELSKQCKEKAFTPAQRVVAIVGLGNVLLREFSQHSSTPTAGSADGGGNAAPGA